MREEDAVYGSDNRGDELPEELRRREQRLCKIQQAVQRFFARGSRRRSQGQGRSAEPEEKGRRFKRPFGEPEEKKQDNFTDPESRIMKTSKGFEQCYNAQLAVDGDWRLIVASTVTQNAADTGQLLPMIEKVRQNTGQIPQSVLADAGYRSEENFRALEQSFIRALIPLGREGKAQATSGSSEKLAATCRMKERLERQDGRKLYAKRKGIIEPVNGWIKAVLGFRHFSVRGLKKVAGEWALVCLALNLKQLRPHWAQA